MTAIDSADLVGLLEELRDELAGAVDELDRARESHRRLESLLLAVLEHVPLPIVVVDQELRVRAAAASAEAAWGAGLDRPLSALESLDVAAIDACRSAMEAGQIRQDDVPAGYGLALLAEPGTGERYAALWATGDR